MGRWSDSLRRCFLSLNTQLTHNKQTNTHTSSQWCVLWPCCTESAQRHVCHIQASRPQKPLPNCCDWPNARRDRLFGFIFENFNNLDERCDAVTRPLGGFRSIAHHKLQGLAVGENKAGLPCFRLESPSSLCIFGKTLHMVCRTLS